MKDIKILFWDIETSYLTAATFSLWPDSISPSQIIDDWRIIGGAWKFSGKKKVHSSYHKNEKTIVKELSEAVSSADIIVHHNGDKFDLKKLNAKVVQYGLKPIPKIATIDTLKVCRREFAFTSNRLDYVGKILGVGGKMENPPNLWMRALQGDKKALKQMEKYNKRDVTLLEDVYLKLRPYIKNHPNMNTFRKDDIDGCPRCGSINLVKYGVYTSQSGTKQKYRCNDCFSFCRGKKSLSINGIRPV